jgi:MOSC domain-containing protein YiiM
VSSDSVGDPDRFLPLEELCRRFNALAPAGSRTGRVALIVRRVDGGVRQVLDDVLVTPEAGVPGDAWERRPNRKEEMQIAVMRIDVARMIANTQPLTLFGDNLFLDLDLSSDSLPTGTPLRVGEAMLEVTAKPHTGCRKFEARFGADARKFVGLPELESRKLRGIYMRVLSAGTVRTGDVVSVLTQE